MIVGRPRFGKRSRKYIGNLPSTDELEQKENLVINRRNHLFPKKFLLKLALDEIPLLIRN